jgi:hypothetical protein
MALWRNSGLHSDDGEYPQRLCLYGSLEGVAERRRTPRVTSYRVIWHTGTWRGAARFCSRCHSATRLRGELRGSRGLVSGSGNLQGRSKRCGLPLTQPAATQKTFAVMKSRDFGLDETHLTPPPGHVQRLIGLLALAFGWTHLAGGKRAAREGPPHVKSHWRRTRSLIRYELAEDTDNP